MPFKTFNAACEHRAVGALLEPAIRGFGGVADRGSKARLAPLASLTWRKHLELSPVLVIRRPEGRGHRRELKPGTRDRCDFLAATARPETGI